jgi:hypothetical protein
MGKPNTLNGEKNADPRGSRFGPVYQDEFRAPEVRSLNATEKELWTALAFRTRSAKGGPENITGMTVRYDDLALDIAKLDSKTGTLKPVNKKTVQRAMRGLLKRGLVHLTLQYRRPPRVVMLRPPSICARCATSDKSCLHRRSQIDHELLKKLGVKTEFSTALSTVGKTLSTQTGQPGCPHREDSQGVHAGSDQDQNSFSKFEKNKDLKIDSTHQTRERQAFRAMEKMVSERGGQLPPDPTDKQIQDAFMRLFTRHGAGG